MKKENKNWEEELEKLKKIKFRKCGIEFGKDGRAFEFEKGKKPLCYVCKMKKMTKKQLQDFAEIMLKRWAK